MAWKNRVLHDIFCVNRKGKPGLGGGVSELRRMKVFIEVAERGSFSAAAISLDASVSAVSRAVNELEDELGVRLLNRNTRKVATTAAGRRYAQLCRQIMDDLSLAKAQIRTQATELVGLVRLSAPLAFGQYALQPVLMDFLQAHPGLELELNVADRPPDLIESGFDLVIMAAKAGFDAAIPARLLMSCQVILCAAPSYVERFGLPQAPEDLASHELLDLSHDLAQGGWWLYGQGRSVDVAAWRQSRFRTNQLSMALLLAEQGMGLVPVPDYVARPSIAAGKLVHLLPEWGFKPLQYYAAIPSRRLLEPRVQALLDHLSVRLR